MTVSPGLLQDALEGHSIAGPDRAEVAALVGLAGRLRRLQPEGPSSLATARMTARFESTIQQPRRGRLFLLLAPWLGLGQRPRPLFQRLAAGALLFASVGGGASVAGGLDPAATTGSVANFISSAVTNLLPRNDNGGPAVPSPTNTPPAPSGAAATPSETPTPGATPTPELPPVASPPPPPAGSEPTFQGPLLPGGPALPSASTPTPGAQSEAVPQQPLGPTATPTTTSAIVPPSTTDVPLPSPTAVATPQPPSPTATSTPPQSPETATPTPQPPSPTPTATESPSSDHDGPSPTASPTATETPRADGRQVDP